MIICYDTPCLNINYNNILKIILDLAKVYYSIANDHLNEIDRLHKVVVAMIADYKSEGKEVPETMKIVWDSEHDSIVEEVDRIKARMERY